MDNDKFKNSPIHDKKAIISMMDELKSEDMAEVVELLKSKQPKNQTALDIVISQLKEEIEKSAHKDASTIRTGDYRIGLSKAIHFCTLAKELEKEQIINARQSHPIEMRKLGWMVDISDGEQYYEETYVTPQPLSTPPNRP